jgi:hypothetical protein
VHVIEHGVLDHGQTWTGDQPRLSMSVNEPVRRRRVAGMDLAACIARQVPVDVYGMRVDALPARFPAFASGRHADLPQHELHARMADHRAYLHTYRWTSLGLSLLEAMTLGSPVLVLAATAAPAAVPTSVVPEKKPRAAGPERSFAPERSAAPERKPADHADVRTRSRESAAGGSAEAIPGPPHKTSSKKETADSKKRSKTLEREIKAIKIRLSAVEAQIQELEARQQEIGLALADPDLYRDGQKAREIAQSRKEIEERVAWLMKEWEELSQRLSAVAAEEP